MFAVLRERLRNKRGSSMLFVLMFMVVFSVVAIAMATVLTASEEVDTIQQTNRQAYLSARSAARTMATYIKNNPSWVDSNVPEYSTGNVASATISGVTLNTTAANTAKAEVSYTDATKTVLKVKGIGTYQGKTATATLTMSKSNATTNVFDNLIYLTSNENFWGNTTFIGKIAVDGSISLGLTTNGGNVHVTGNVYAKGNVTLENACTVTGDIFTEGNLSVYSSNLLGSGTVMGNMYEDADTSGNTLGGGSTFGQTSSIFDYNGDFIHASYETHGNNYFGTYNQGAANYTFNEMDFSGVHVSIPAAAPTKSDSNTLTTIIGNMAASNAGQTNFTVTPTDSSTDPVYYYLTDLSATWPIGYGANITLSAGNSNRDIVLIMDSNTTLSGVNIYIDGSTTNRVILYMADNTTLTLMNTHIGADITTKGNNRIVASHLFILGTDGGGQSIYNDNTDGNAAIYGYVYLPNGTLTLGNNTDDQNGYFLTGGAILQTLNMDTNQKIYYIAPTVSMPDELTATSSTGSIMWNIGKWS